MKDKNLNHHTIDEILNQLTIYLKNKQLEDIPDKKKFLQDLYVRISQNQEIIVQNKEKYYQPLTNLWEQFFFGKNNYSLIFSSATIFLLFFIFTYHQLRIKEKQPTPNEVRGFGSSSIQNQNKNIQSPSILEEEKQLLEKYLSEENQEKKQKLLKQLIEFYRKMRQEDKIKKLMEQLD